MDIKAGTNVTLGPNQIKFKWSVAMESAVDSSFFWGYLVTQIPGGFLASIYPANRIFGTAIACSAFLNMFLPGAFEFPGVIICIRVLQGLVEVKSSLRLNSSGTKKIFSCFSLTA